jgi:microcin C transport system substrate-binding protein
MCNCRFLALLLLIAPLVLQAQSPSVSPELGGPGFERIAASKGWKTGTISEKEMQYIGDSRAVKGGQFRFAIEEFPPTLRAYGLDDNTSSNRIISNLVYETLIGGVNPLTLEFLPGLASHWKVDPDDHQTYWFRIDPNARFSDGHPVTTEDVIATYGLAIDSTILSPFTNSFFAGFDPPETISPYVFKVHSKEENWKSMIYFASSVILPAHVIGNLSGKAYLANYNYDMVPGSGPYIVYVRDIKKQKSITLRRRTDWWQRDYPIHARFYNFDQISMIVIQDRHLSLEKFKSDDIDFCVVTRSDWWNNEFAFDEAERGLVQRRKVFTDEPVGIGGFVFNTRTPPLDDIRVRAAFIHLFNRERILGAEYPAEYGITDSYYPNSIYENPSNPKDRFDPEKAAQLLAEAGYTTRNAEGVLVNTESGKPLELEVPSPPGTERIITLAQKDLLKGGIKLKLRKVDWPSNFALLNKREFDVGWVNWGGMVYPDPISSFHSKIADQPNTSNLAGLKNAHADSLMELELHTFDQATRVKIIRELDSTLMASKIYALSWYTPYTRIAYWNRFGHPDFYISRMGDWESILSTWWFNPKNAATVKQGKVDTTVKMPVGNTDVRFWEEWKKRHK